MERLGIDISGKWPKTDRGNQYILVIGDYFTKFIEAFPMPNMEAETVAEIVVTQFILRYGCPRIILSDQRSQFMSKVFKRCVNYLKFIRCGQVAFDHRLTVLLSEAI